MRNFNFQGNLLTLPFGVQLPISKKPIEGCTAASKMSPHAPLEWECPEKCQNSNSAHCSK